MSNLFLKILASKLSPMVLWEGFLKEVMMKGVGINDGGLESSKIEHEPPTLLISIFTSKESTSVCATLFQTEGLCLILILFFPCNLYVLAHSRHSTNTSWIKACHGFMKRTLNYKSNGLLGFIPDHVLKRNLNNLSGTIFLCWRGHIIHLIGFLWASLLTLKIFLVNVSTFGFCFHVYDQNFDTWVSNIISPAILASPSAYLPDTTYLTSRGTSK